MIDWGPQKLKLKADNAKKIKIKEKSLPNHEFNLKPPLQTVFVTPVPKKKDGDWSLKSKADSDHNDANVIDLDEGQQRPPRKARFQAWRTPVKQLPPAQFGHQLSSSTSWLPPR